MELLHSKALDGGADGASTQKYVDVEEVRDSTIILKNGSLRAVLMVSSINFDLKSTEDQDTTIAQYQNFLNSLDFPIEILITSRRLNITPYLDYLRKKESRITNELLAFQLTEYQKFIKSLAEVSNIMAKNFYIVVPFYPVENIKKGILEGLLGVGSSGKTLAVKGELFAAYRSQLWQRLDQINAGLSGIGLKVAPLNTEELIELLYNSYNPSLHTTTLIKEIGKVELK